MPDVQYQVVVTLVDGTSLVRTVTAADVVDAANRVGEDLAAVVVALAVKQAS